MPKEGDSFGTPKAVERVKTPPPPPLHSPAGICGGVGCMSLMPESCAFFLACCGASCWLEGAA